MLLRQKTVLSIKNDRINYGHFLLANPLQPLSGGSTITTQQLAKKQPIYRRDQTVERKAKNFPCLRIKQKYSKGQNSNHVP